MQICADCGAAIGQDRGPQDGWQLDDGRTVCHKCCVADTRQLLDNRLACGNFESEGRMKVASDARGSATDLPYEDSGKTN